MAKWNPTFTKEELQSEEWRPVYKYEGLYEVSSLGRLRSLPRRGTRTDTVLLMSLHLNRDGYVCARLCQNAISHEYKIHRLVLEAFIGLKPRDKEANHIRPPKTNNRPGNLEWVTHGENIHHAHRTGLVSYRSGNDHWTRKRPELIKRGAANRRTGTSNPAVRGEKNHNAIFTTALILAMRNDLANGLSLRLTAVKYHTSRTTVKNIKTRRAWAHI